eukprot:scaffold3952_cov116-Isochrysis_galbana.AAC.2
MGDPALYPEIRTARFLYAMQSASSAYSSGRGKLSRRGPLYPLPHLVGGDGSILSGIASRASLTLSSPPQNFESSGGRTLFYSTAALALGQTDMRMLEGSATYTTYHLTSARSRQGQQAAKDQDPYHPYH